MRIYTEGFEYGPSSTGISGWNFTNPVIDDNQGGVTARKDINGNGGTYFARNGLGPNASRFMNTTSEFSICGIKDIRPKEIWFRSALYTTTGEQPVYSFENRYNESQVSVRLDTSTGQALIYRKNYHGSGKTLLGTSTNTFPINQWVLFEFHIYIDNTNGFVRIYIDNSDTLFYEVTSVDTQEDSEGGISNLKLHPTTLGGMDDIAINAPTILYDGGTGSAPVAGNTITGGTSGATATITAVEGNATSGRLWLENVDVDPNPFQDNEIISGSGFSASVNAPHSSYVNGLEPQSWRVGDGYIVGMRPNADDTIGCDGSDGNQVNNYQLVDDPAGALSSVDFVSTGTLNTGDLYDIESFTDIGFSSGQVSTVNAVNVRTYSRKSGGSINDIEIAINSNVTTDYSPESPLPVDWALRDWTWSYNPDDNEAWEEADINALIAGFRFQS